MPCQSCQDPTLCTDRCQAYALELSACEASGQMDSRQVAAHQEAGEMPNIYDEEWVCEAHPDKPFQHDGCRGAGMLSDESCARLRQVAAHVEAGEMPRSCTCHQDDNPPKPCARKYALSECIAAPKGEAGEMEAAKRDERG